MEQKGFDCARGRFVVVSFSAITEPTRQKSRHERAHASFCGSLHARRVYLCVHGHVWVPASAARQKKPIKKKKKESYFVEIDQKLHGFLLSNRGVCLLTTFVIGPAVVALSFMCSLFLLTFGVWCFCSQSRLLFIIRVETVRKKKYKLTVFKNLLVNNILISYVGSTLSIRVSENGNIILRWNINSTLLIRVGRCNIGTKC